MFTVRGPREIGSHALPGAVYLVLLFGCLPCPSRRVELAFPSWAFNAKLRLADAIEAVSPCIMDSISFVLYHLQVMCDLQNALRYRLAHQPFQQFVGFGPFSGFLGVSLLIRAGFDCVLRYCHDVGLNPKHLSSKAFPCCYRPTQRRPTVTQGSDVTEDSSPRLPHWQLQLRA